MVSAPICLQWSKEKGYYHALCVTYIKQCKDNLPAEHKWCTSECSGGKSKPITNYVVLHIIMPILYSPTAQVQVDAHWQDSK